MKVKKYGKEGQPHWIPSRFKFPKLKNILQEKPR